METIYLYSFTNSLIINNNCLFIIVSFELYLKKIFKNRKYTLNYTCIKERNI